MDAIRLVPPRRYVVRGGTVVARAVPARHTVIWNGKEEDVTFLRP